jgi:hypothetical protein
MHPSSSNGDGGERRFGQSRPAANQCPAVLQSSSPATRETNGVRFERVPGGEERDPSPSIHGGEGPAGHALRERDIPRVPGVWWAES